MATSHSNTFVRGALVLAALFSVARAEPSCAGGAACNDAKMRDLCKTAYLRFEDDGIYKSDSSGYVAYAAKSGNLGCMAQLKCNSAGGPGEFTGKVLKSA